MRYQPKQRRTDYSQLIRNRELEEHPEYRALLQTIIKWPEDDAPRLIFSDWLEEHDELESARFIRERVSQYRSNVAGRSWQKCCVVHVDLLPQQDDEPPYTLDLFGVQIPKPLIHPAKIVLFERRGFIGLAECSHSAFIAACDMLFSEYPLQQIRLSTLQCEVLRGNGDHRFWQRSNPIKGVDRWFENSCSSWEIFISEIRPYFAHLDVIKIGETAHVRMSKACVRYGRIRLKIDE